MWYDYDMRFYNMSSSSSSAYECAHCWGTSLPYGRIRRKGHHQGCKCSRTNGLTWLPKHVGARDNQFLGTYLMTDQCCLAIICNTDIFLNKLNGDGSQKQNLCIIWPYHHHHRPINVSIAGAQAFLTDYT
jgi:hypothetical protein